MGCGTNSVSIRICGFANELASDARSLNLSYALEGPDGP